MATVAMNAHQVTKISTVQPVRDASKSTSSILYIYMYTVYHVSYLYMYSVYYISNKVLQIAVLPKMIARNSVRVHVEQIARGQYATNILALLIRATVVNFPSGFIEYERWRK